MQIFFDIENSPTELHCIALQAEGWEEPRLYHGQEAIDAAVTILMNASELVGHNIIEYDIPEIKRLTGRDISGTKLTDTLQMSRVFFPDMMEVDVSQNRIDKRYYGRHSLESWGARLDFPKDDYKAWCDANSKDDPWAYYDDEMGRYCQQDVRVTMKLYATIVARIKRKGYKDARRVLRFESAVAHVCRKMELEGWRFDVDAATRLEHTLRIRKAELEDEFKTQWPAFYMPGGEITPPKPGGKFWGFYTKVKWLKAGPVADGPGDGTSMYWGRYTRVTHTEFNPGSRDHVAHKLKETGWSPAQLTDTGKAKIDETVLQDIDHPKAKLMAEYFLVAKRLGQLVDGNAGWLRTHKDGRLHGRTNHMGTITSRAAHSGPNLGQVPAGRAPYGKECRALFLPDEGHVMVGCDLSGIELRCLAHYLHGFDGGEYATIILEGDIHTANQNAAGLETRDQAKTFIYALIYGAGNTKIGSIVDGTEEEGAALKERFFTAMPALDKLTKLAKKQAKQRKDTLRGLDGRILPVRSAHKALNVLLQSAGAIVAKGWLILVDRRIGKYGARVVGWIHDELQVSCPPEHAETVGQLMVECAAEAGTRLGFKMPVGAEFSIGKNWSETH